MAARVRLPNLSSLPSKRSNSVKASAVPPAKPPSTLPLPSGRTLRALPFITVLPSVTWPSPPMATAPLRRTARMVVPCGLKLSDHWRPTSCVSPEGGKRRRCGPGGRNQGACRSASWRCRRGRAAPARRANPYSIQADAWRKNGGTGADARGSAGPCAAPSTRCAAGSARCLRRVPFLPTNTRRLVDGRERRALAQPGAQRRRAPCGPRARCASCEPLPSTRTVRSARSRSREVEADELGEPQARRIEQLHDRAVAHGERVFGRDVEQLVELVDVERARQALRRLRRADVHGRIARHDALAQQVVEEPAHRRQAPLHAARAQAAGMRARGEHAHVLAVELLPVGEIAALGVVRERAQVARVVRRGVRRETPLGARDALR